MYEIIKKDQTKKISIKKLDEKEKEKLHERYCEGFGIIDEYLINNVICDNVFVPLSQNSVNEYFQNYVKYINPNLSDFPQRLNFLFLPHSSHILTFNIFEYWRKSNCYNPILKSMNMNSSFDYLICFEKEFNIYKKNPRIDVLFSNNKNMGIGIECKYSESYNSQNKKFNWDVLSEYLKMEYLWHNLKNLKYFSNDLCQNKLEYRYFNITQSIIYILALHYNFNQVCNNYFYVYLFYPSQFANENNDYINETKEFTNALKLDNVNFIYKSFYELISDLSNNIDTKDRDYINYLKKRYII